MQRGNTAIFAAVMNDHAVSALELLQKGADMDIVCVSVYLIFVLRSVLYLVFLC